MVSSVHASDQFASSGHLHVARLWCESCGLRECLTFAELIVVHQIQDLCKEPAQDWPRYVKHCGIHVSTFLLAT